MSLWREIQTKEFKENPFTFIAKEWLLITAGDETKTNAMTASWGGLGHIWGKDVAYIVIRPQRYTKEFVDTKGCFSLCCFGSDFRQELAYLGKVSGRNEDKITKCGLQLNYDGQKPYFEEAKQVLFCKVLYQQNLTPENFIEKQLDAAMYPDKDYHTLYVAEIEKIIVKND
ncbi:flavin reductase [Clostridia bacterium]|nr:flavin reductase [Clostridia bacterium]